jgi:5-bromo-4-chloroindolyl phosphate hydrolysis protein
MAQIDKDTTFTLTIKDAAGLGVFLVGILSVYFTLKADIALAMERPEPVISEQEYHYKDEIVRKTIMLTQQDVDGIKDDVEEIKETLKTLEQRLYEIQ